MRALQENKSKVYMVGEGDRSKVTGDGAVRFEKKGTNFLTSVAHGIIGFSENLIRFARRKRTKVRTNHNKNRPTV